MLEETKVLIEGTFDDALNIVAITYKELTGGVGKWGDTVWTPKAIHKIEGDTVPEKWHEIKAILLK